ncbi:MFS transporter [Saccharothrix violaceirubra]|uniref:Putative MFS family arabinose efflux permease n=1 Tax=Saccharothrix violaceirubra TaxID=413306 RepID=A0A7W7T1U7_9PSEU|nr:MFS transporter [Saccharothrix violaceirubra]MBB4965008.1 putative MFS family arabinose efflux permease [Saccharothrix violaceirubra]
MGTGFRAAFAVPEFRVLWSAAALSTIGDQLARVALSVLVFERTGSAAWTALTYALTMLPALVSGVLLSGLADRFPRRTVMVVSDALRAVLLGVMAVPGVPLSLVAALLVVAQLAEAPFSAAQGALLPTVLGDRYEAGQSVHLITHQSGLLLGFVGGGLVVAWLGTSGALAVDAATFAVSALVLRLGLVHRPVSGVVKRTHVRIREGAALVWRDRRLRLLVTLGWLALFTVVPEGLAAPFSAESGIGVEGVGLLLAADPAGMVLGTVLLRFLPTDRRVRLLGLLAVATALPLAGYLLAPPLAGAVALLALSGVFSAYQVTAGATFVRLVPDEQRGQALGFARSGLVAAQGVGVAGGGLLATATGSAGTAIAVSGVVGAVLAALVTLAWSRVSVPAA